MGGCDVCEAVIILLPVMIISSFTPTTPPEPVASIINQIFRDRLHRRLKVDRTDFPTPMPELKRDQSQFSHQSEEGEMEDRVLLQSGVGGVGRVEDVKSVEGRVRLRAIGRAMGQWRHSSSLKAANQLYNHYLLHFLHRSNQLLVRQGVPPPLSVLETANEGDYILGDTPSKFERKDFPHYSNVILPQDLPPDNCSFHFHRHFQKVTPEERYFQIEDNCVLKLTQVYQFVASLFRRSIAFSRTKRRLEGETENHDFEAISEELGVHFRTAKLLYDLLNSFYDFEREMARGEEPKQRASDEITDSLKEILALYRSGSAAHLPHEQQYISLRELRLALTEKMLSQQEGQAMEAESEGE